MVGVKGGPAVFPQATFQRLVVIGHARSQNGWLVSAVGRISIKPALSGALDCWCICSCRSRPSDHKQCMMSNTKGCYGRFYDSFAELVRLEWQARKTLPHSDRAGPRYTPLKSARCKMVLHIRGSAAKRSIDSVKSEVPACGRFWQSKIAGNTL